MKRKMLTPAPILALAAALPVAVWAGSTKTHDA
jgi:hypothetical protein